MADSDLSLYELNFDNREDIDAVCQRYPILDTLFSDLAPDAFDPPESELLRDYSPILRASGKFKETRFKTALNHILRRGASNEPVPFHYGPATDHFRVLFDALVLSNVNHIDEGKPLQLRFGQNPRAVIDSLTYVCTTLFFGEFPNDTPFDENAPIDGELSGVNGPEQELMIPYSVMVYGQYYSHFTRFHAEPEDPSTCTAEVMGQEWFDGHSDDALYSVEKWFEKHNGTINWQDQLENARENGGNSVFNKNDINCIELLEGIFSLLKRPNQSLFDVADQDKDITVFRQEAGLCFQVYLTHVLVCDIFDKAAAKRGQPVKGRFRNDLDQQVLNIFINKQHPDRNSDDLQRRVQDLNFEHLPSTTGQENMFARWAVLYFLHQIAVNEKIRECHHTIQLALFGTIAENDEMGSIEDPTDPNQPLQKNQLRGFDFQSCDECKKELPQGDTSTKPLLLTAPGRNIVSLTRTAFSGMENKHPKNVKIPCTVRQKCVDRFGGSDGSTGVFQNYVPQDQYDDSDLGLGVCFDTVGHFQFTDLTMLYQVAVPLKNIYGTDCNRGVDELAAQEAQRKQDWFDAAQKLRLAVDRHERLVEQKYDPERCVQQDAQRVDHTTAGQTEIANINMCSTQTLQELEGKQVMFEDGTNLKLTMRHIVVAETAVFIPKTRDNHIDWSVVDAYQGINSANFNDGADNNSGERSRRAVRFKELVRILKEENFRQVLFDFKRDDNTTIKFSLDLENVLVSQVTDTLIDNGGNEDITVLPTTLQGIVDSEGKAGTSICVFIDKVTTVGEYAFLTNIIEILAAISQEEAIGVSSEVLLEAACAFYCFLDPTNHRAPTIQSSNLLNEEIDMRSKDQLQMYFPSLFHHLSPRIFNRIFDELFRLMPGKKKGPDSYNLQKYIRPFTGLPDDDENEPSQNVILSEVHRLMLYTFARGLSQKIFMVHNCHIQLLELHFGRFTQQQITVMPIESRNFQASQSTIETKFKSPDAGHRRVSVLAIQLDDSVAANDIGKLLSLLNSLPNTITLLAFNTSLLEVLSDMSALNSKMTISTMDIRQRDINLSASEGTTELTSCVTLSAAVPASSRQAFAFSDSEVTLSYIFRSTYDAFKTKPGKFLSLVNNLQSNASLNKPISQQPLHLQLLKFLNPENTLNSKFYASILSLESKTMTTLLNFFNVQNEARVIVPIDEGFRLEGQEININKLALIDGSAPGVDTQFAKVVRNAEENINDTYLVIVEKAHLCSTSTLRSYLNTYSTITHNNQYRIKVILQSPTFEPSFHLLQPQAMVYLTENPFTVLQRVFAAIESEVAHCVRGTNTNHNRLDYSEELAATESNQDSLNSTPNVTSDINEAINGSDSSVEDGEDDDSAPSPFMPVKEAVVFALHLLGVTFLSGKRTSRDSNISFEQYGQTQDQKRLLKALAPYLHKVISRSSAMDLIDAQVLGRFLARFCTKYQEILNLQSVVDYATATKDAIDMCVIVLVAYIKGFPRFEFREGQTGSISCPDKYLKILSFEGHLRNTPGIAFAPQHIRVLSYFATLLEVTMSPNEPATENVMSSTKCARLTDVIQSPGEYRFINTLTPCILSCIEKKRTQNSTDPLFQYVARGRGDLDTQTVLRFAKKSGEIDYNSAIAARLQIDAETLFLAFDQSYSPLSILLLLEPDKIVSLMTKLSNNFQVDDHVYTFLAREILNVQILLQESQRKYPDWFRKRMSVIKVIVLNALCVLQSQSLGDFMEEFVTADELAVAVPFLSNVHDKLSESILILLLESSKPLLADQSHLQDDILRLNKDGSSDLPQFPSSVRADVCWGALHVEALQQNRTVPWMPEDYKDFLNGNLTPVKVENLSLKLADQVQLQPTKQGCAYVVKQLSKSARTNLKSARMLARFLMIHDFPLSSLLDSDTQEQFFIVSLLADEIIENGSSLMEERMEKMRQALEESNTMQDTAESLLLFLLAAGSPDRFDRDIELTYEEGEIWNGLISFHNSRCDPTKPWGILLLDWVFKKYHDAPVSTREEVSLNTLCHNLSRWLNSSINAKKFFNYANSLGNDPNYVQLDLVLYFLQPHHTLVPLAWKFDESIISENARHLNLNHSQFASKFASCFATQARISDPYLTHQLRKGAVCEQSLLQGPMLMMEKYGNSVVHTLMTHDPVHKKDYFGSKAMNAISSLIAVLVDINDCTEFPVDLQSGCHPTSLVWNISSFTRLLHSPEQVQDANAITMVLLFAWFKAAGITQNFFAKCGINDDVSFSSTVWQQKITKSSLPRVKLPQATMEQLEKASHADDPTSELKSIMTKSVPKVIFHIAAFDRVHYQSNSLIDSTLEEQIDLLFLFNHRKIDRSLVSESQDPEILLKRAAQAFNETDFEPQEDFEIWRAVVLFVHGVATMGPNAFDIVRQIVTGPKAELMNELFAQYSEAPQRGLDLSAAHLDKILKKKKYNYVHSISPDLLYEIESSSTTGSQLYQSVDAHEQDTSTSKTALTIPSFLKPIPAEHHDNQHDIETITLDNSSEVRKPHNPIVNGRVMIDVSLLIKLHVEASAINTRNFYFEQQVLPGKECFFVLVKDRAVDRLNQSHIKSTNQVPQTYVRFESSKLNLKAEEKILESFASYHDAWQYLDNSAGPSTLLITQDSFLYYRVTGREWKPYIPVSAFKPSAKLSPLKLWKELDGLIQCLPKCVKVILKYMDEYYQPEAIPVLHDVLEEILRTHEGSKSTVLDRIKHLKNGHELTQEQSKIFWNAIRELLLGYSGFVPHVFGSNDGDKSKDLLSGNIFDKRGELSQTIENLDLDHIKPEHDKRMLFQANDLNLCFIDVFRERKDTSLAFQQGESSVIFMFYPKVWHDNLLFVQDGRTRLEEKDIPNFSAKENQAARWIRDVLGSELYPQLKWMLLKLVFSAGNSESEDGNQSGPEEKLSLPPSHLHQGVALCRCCPNTFIKNQLCNVFDWQRNIQGNNQLSRFRQRRQNRYGVAVISELPHLEEFVGHKEIKVTEIDKLRPEQLYLKIIGGFSQQHNHVVVDGLDHASDLFLKWCCEYTERWVWRYIFFKNLDLTYNLPEIRDRVVVNQDNQRDTVGLIKWTRSYDSLADNNIVPVVEISRPSALNDVAWKDDILASFGLSGDGNTEFGKRLIYLYGSPGTGKSHLSIEIQQQMQKANFIVKQFDCSDDRLVRDALSFLLEETFSDGSQRSLLIADEFHLLLPRQKKEFFEWVLPRLKWLKVLLIGNRISQVDKDLLSFLQEHQNKLYQSFKGTDNGDSDNDDKMRPQIRDVEAKLSIPYMHDICHREGHTQTQNDEQEKLFEFCFNTWFRAIYMLLGDESLSLRSAFAVCPRNTPFTFKWDLVVADDDVRLVQTLSSLLHSSFPTLGQTFCQELALAFNDFVVVQLRSRKQDLTADCDFSEICLSSGTSFAANSVVRGVCIAAVYAALNPQLNETVPASCVDYLRGPVTQKQRPVTAIKNWASKICSKLTFGSDRDFIWLAQEPFPLCIKVEEDQDNTPLPSGKIWVRGTSSFDLSLIHLAERAQHRMPIDWEKVSEYWKDHPIDNVKLFEALLQNCWNRQLCLDAVEPDQLLILLERSAKAAEDGAGFIASEVAQAYGLAHIIENHVKDEVDTNKAKLLFATMWRCLIAGTLEITANETVLAVYNAIEAQMDMMKNNVDPHNSMVLEMLRWLPTSPSAFNIYTTSRAKASELMQVKLVNYLAIASNYISNLYFNGEKLPSQTLRHSSAEDQSQDGLDDIRSLWQGKFCSLLRWTEPNVSLSLNHHELPLVPLNFGSMLLVAQSVDVQLGDNAEGSMLPILRTIMNLASLVSDDDEHHSMPFPTADDLSPLLSVDTSGQNDAIHDKWVALMNGFWLQSLDDYNLFGVFIQGFSLAVYAAGASKFAPIIQAIATVTAPQGMSPQLPPDNRIVRSVGIEVISGNAIRLMFDKVMIPCPAWVPEM